MFCNHQCSFYRDNIDLLNDSKKTMLYHFPAKMTLQDYRDYAKFLDRNKSKEKIPYCLLARMKVSDLSFCPNRDRIACSDTITCESCGRIVSSEESYFRRYDAFRFKWYGECMECREKRKEKKLLKHSCIEKANKYGICTACGLVLPGSPLDV